MKFYLLFLFVVSTSLQAQDALEVLSVDYAQPTGGDSSASTLRGQLRPVNYTVLSAGIDGRLKSFPVKTGSSVARGDVLARFSCSQEEAEHKIAVARAAVAEKNVEVNRKLDAYQNVSELDLSKSEAELQIAKAEVVRMEAVITKCVIRSPFDATVTEKMIQAHQYVNKGEPLIEIVDTKNLEIEMVLPSVNVSRYKRGLPFTIDIDETGERVTARIDRIVNVVDPVSQTIRIIGTIPDTSHNLMPGMSGVINFSGLELTDG